MMNAPPSCKSWITTNVVGGLGNQLFLVANLLATARRNDLEAVLPKYALSSSQDEPRPTYWNSIFADLPLLGVVDRLPPTTSKPHEVVVPERRPVKPVVLPDPAANTLYNMVGFFQSDQFFPDYPFLPSFVPARLRDVASRVLTENYVDGPTLTHVVAMHIRRGDYLKYTDVFETLDMTYYDTALRQLFGHQLVMAGTGASGSTPPLRVLVFCDEEKHGDFAVGYLSGKYRGLEVALVHPKNEQRFALEESVAQPREVVELLMMAQCHDVVMANSTFSWWGAYLNDKPLHRTVAPSKWFVQHPYPQSNHLYGADWILL